MSDRPRYAIYFAPEPGTSLAEFGRSVLGYDAETGASAPFPDRLLGQFPDWAAMASEPARYGFHATLKAPFELRSGVDEHQLLGETAGIAARLAPIGLGELDVTLMSRLWRSRRETGPAKPARIESTIVRMLDHLRAPLSAVDLERRQASGLTDRQQAQLARWGYPFVLEDYRFHMTLTGPLASDMREPVLAALAEAYSGFRGPVRLDAVCIFRQPSRSERFRVTARIPLGG